ncbi:MAG: 50S ribosomal protein L29 [Myxococcales bacterium]
MKATEARKQIRELSSDELKAKATELKSELFKAKIQNHTNQLDSTAKLRGLRREIARINTVLTQREAKS